MKVEGSVWVNRSPAEVFAYLSDPRSSARWTAGLIEASTAGHQLAPGTTLHIVGHLLGERLESLAEVTHYERDRVLCCKSVSGPVPYWVGFTLDRLGAGVEVTQTVEADVRFFRLPEELVRRVAQRQLEHDLATLRDLIETQGSPRSR
jgi:carbon monoxide dehydrogenase subunit G